MYYILYYKYNQVSNKRYAVLNDSVIGDTKSENDMAIENYKSH